MASHPEFAGQWLRQRDKGARAVAEVEAEELRLLTPDEALAESDALLSAIDLGVASEGREATSGFVEQQRLFGRSRE